MGCGVQSCPAAVFVANICAVDQTLVGGEQAAQKLDVTRRTGVEESSSVFRLATLNFFFQGTPTREPVFSGNSQQCNRELGLWVSTTEFAQAIFCEFLQVFERRTFGEL